MRRIAVTVAVTCVALSSGPPSIAEVPRGGRTSFHAETPPLPVTVVRGEWSGVGKRVQLELEGAHVVGDHTRFTARWTTPWSEPRKYPHVEGEASFEVADALGKTFSLGLMVRHRIEGGAWTSWRGSPRDLVFGQGAHLVPVAFAEGVRLSHPHRVRFDVRFVGRMDDPAAIHGYVDLMLRDPD